MPLVRMRLAAALIGVVTILTLAGCSSSPKVSRSEVQTQTAKLLQEQSGAEQPPQVECPGDLQGQVGTTMVCSVSGTGQVLTLKVTGITGQTVNFEVAGQPVLPQ